MVYLVFLWILNVIGLRGCIIADFFFSWEEGGGGERTPVPGMLSGMRSCWTDALPAGFSSREVLVAVRAVRFRA